MPSPMSALGQKLTLPPHFRMSALSPKADTAENRRDVRQKYTRLRRSGERSLMRFILVQ
jgi:hypothetical protein